MKNLIILTDRQNGAGAPHAFTLLDLLAVVATVALLTLVALPSLAANRGKSKAMQCLDNVRAINVGTALYTEENGYYPPLWVQPGNPRWPNWTFDSTRFVVQNASALFWPDALRLEGYVKDSNAFSCAALTSSGTSAKSALGIGINYPNIGKTITASDSSTLPPKPSDVRHPGQTAIYGDSGPATVSSFILSNPDNWTEDSPYVAVYGSSYYFRTPSDMSFSAGDAVMIPRHDHRVVTGWADGHVELFKNSRIGWQYPQGNTNALWDLY
jgi:prepilin-type processing-associated H-X9-DG protein